MFDEHYSEMYDDAGFLIGVTHSTDLGKRWAEEAWEKDMKNRHNASLGEQRFFETDREFLRIDRSIEQIEHTFKKTSEDIKRARLEYLEEKVRQVKMMEQREHQISLERKKAREKLMQEIDGMEEEREIVRELFERAIKFSVGIAMIYVGIVGGL